jgi:hypothetical protein
MTTAGVAKRRGFTACALGPKRDPKESFSRVIRRVLSERPALTAGDLLAAMQAFEGKGAGPRRRRDRNAAA